ncbi:MAG TPA: hypothetical protein VK179_20830 [Bacteroidales bacterium]|nr:hypothetical protein [Bacteroidales bacterium]
MQGCNSNAVRQEENKIRFSAYFIPVEGGHIDMKLDSITPVDSLIPQLRYKNQLYETYKGYWIGYNDLMFSIAVYSERAIKPLIDFIDTTNIESRIPAIYTLHLIGINCRIAGRTYEQFSNKQARRALLSLLVKYDSLQPLIMSLLNRDPKESDIPVLLNIMDSVKTNCWAITKALNTYHLKDAPVKTESSWDYLLYSFPERVSDDQAILYKKLWLDWWKKQDDSYKEYLKKSNIKIKDSVYN